MLTSDQFERTRRLALRLAGIELLERHRELLQRRCRRIEILSPASFDALLSAAESGDPTANRRLLGLVTTNFTGFFRHSWHFEVAARHALEAAHLRGQARLWSAAAATGEEPYSLAMALLEVFRRDDPPATILATDINEEALALARRGDYGDAALGTLKAEQRSRFFTKSTHTKRWHLVPAAQRLVESRALNLVDPVWPMTAPFDVVLCRNVLMYLDVSVRYTILERMASMVAPDGVLIMDPAESPGEARHWFKPVTNGVYSFRKGSAAGRHAPIDDRQHEKERP